jgi:hypothetical protein
VWDLQFLSQLLGLRAFTRSGGTKQHKSHLRNPS